MAVMSPQPSTVAEQHKLSPAAAPTPTSAVMGSTASEEATGMDLDLHGSNKESHDVGPASPGDAPGDGRPRSPFVNGNAPAKDMNAPPSPPIPTPPLHASTETNGNTEGLSDFHITSPDGSGVNTSMNDDIKMDQEVKSVDEEVKPTEDVKMENGESQGGVKRSSEGEEKGSAESEDREMEDPDDRPLKRAKTEDGPADTVSAATSTELAGPITPARLTYTTGVLRSLRRMRSARQFNMPVDVVKFNIPHYYQLVKIPMDLSTVEKKLISNEYSSIEAFKADMDLIVENSRLFNGDEHAVTKEGKSMLASFYKLMQDLPAEDVVELEKPKPKKKGGSSATKAPKAKTPKPKTPVAKSEQSPAAAPERFGLHPSGVPQVRRNSEKSDGRPKREIHPPASKDLPYMKPRRKHNAQELKFCQSVLKEMLSKKHDTINFPFKVPVDPVALNIPDYFKIIKNPMDLSTIQQKLKDNEYENANEFEADVRLMFQNCYKFNPQSQPVHQMGRKLEEIFDEAWKAKPAPTVSRAPSYLSEGDEEAEGSEEEPETDVHHLEQQLEAMKNQIAAMKKSKKKTPVPKKKGAAPRKGSVSVPKKATKKVPYVTLEQKTELSERINYLTLDKMQTAMDMLRKNMPQLQDVDSSELELDIDELDRNTLWKIWCYVDKYAPPSKVYVPPPPPPEPVSQNKRKAAAAAAAAAKPRKNKPMTATEQEEKIQRLQQQVHQFDNRGAITPQAADPPAEEESSDDDDVDSASESEEE